VEVRTGRAIRDFMGEGAGLQVILAFSVREKGRSEQRSSRGSLKGLSRERVSHLVGSLRSIAKG